MATFFDVEKIMNPAIKELIMDLRRQFDILEIQSPDGYYEGEEAETFICEYLVPKLHILFQLGKDEGRDAWHASAFLEGVRSTNKAIDEAMRKHYMEVRGAEDGKY